MEIVKYKDRFKSFHAKSVFWDLFKEQSPQPRWKSPKSELTKDELDAA